MSLPPLPDYPRSAYIDPTPELLALRRLTPAQHGWGRGWPHECPTKAQLETPEIVRPRDGKVFGRPVRRELALLFGRLFTYAMLLDPTWELRTREELHGGQGGVSCRAIKRSKPQRPSNHSQGRAWDADSSGNPMRKPGEPFISRQSPILVRLAAAALVFWGGWYFDADRNAYVDAMHFEFVGRVSDVARALRQLDEEYERIRAELYPPEEPEMSAAQVKAVQQAMNDLGWTPSLVIDGDYGQKTTAAVEGIAASVRDRNARAVEAARTEERRRAAGQVAAAKSGALAAVRAARADVTQLATTAAESANARLDRLETDLAK